MIKVVAIGNRFMRDDGIAIEVAEAIKERFGNQNVEIIIGETDCYNSFTLLESEDFVLIMDAFYQGTEPGSIHIFKLEEILSQPISSFMQHEMSIFELMKLYGSSYRGYAIGIEIAEVSFDVELSPILRGKFQQICSEMEKIIKRIIEEEISHA